MEFSALIKKSAFALFFNYCVNDRRIFSNNYYYEFKSRKKLPTESEIDCVVLIRPA